jgi:hypothetical protein
MFVKLSHSSSCAELACISVSPADCLHNIACGLHNIADGLQNITVGMHSIAEELHNIPEQ